MNKKELKIKKILVGICGIGNGHINRQICVIKELLKNNKDYKRLWSRQSGAFLDEK